MKEPSKFGGSGVLVPGLGGDTLEFRVSNMGTDKYKASLSVNGGRWEVSASSFAQAKNAYADLYNKYKQNKNKYKGKKFSASEMSDLMS